MVIADSFFLRVFTDYGLIGLWGFIAFEAFEFVASIPMGPVVIFAGSLARAGNLSLVGVWLTVFTALVTGDNLGFFVGRKFGRPILLKYGTRFIKPGTLERADRVLLRYGAWGVFVSRFFLASIAAQINILAGASPLPWRRYFPAEVFGQAVWATLYVGLGYVLGDRLLLVIDAVNQADVTLIGAANLIAVVGVVWFYYRAIKHHVHVHRKHRRQG
ncbi:MAG: DedA family protein [Patescibacteria group bacterium]